MVRFWFMAFNATFRYIYDFIENCDIFIKLNDIFRPILFVVEKLHSPKYPLLTCCKQV